MTVYLLMYCTDVGAREDWMPWYTPTEIFSTPEKRADRKAELQQKNPKLDFHEEDYILDELDPRGGKENDGKDEEDE